jgi:hypothetical protein
MRFFKQKWLEKRMDIALSMYLSPKKSTASGQPYIFIAAAKSKAADGTGNF